MNRLQINVQNLSQVLIAYDQIKVYSAPSATGTFTELTTSATRIALIPGASTYFFTDSEGASSTFYTVSYFNSTTLAESAQSSPFQAGYYAQKVGYSFGNYSAPPNEWGQIMTPDDMRYTYLWGIDSVANDVAQSTFDDPQFAYFVETALADFELYLTMDIRKRVYKTQPASNLVQANKWIAGVDYTDEENPYDFDPMYWQNWGFLQLRHYPVISIERFLLQSQIATTVIDLAGKNWIRLDKQKGQVRMFPKTGFPYGPFAVGALPWYLMGTRYPEGFVVDYTTGYQTSDLVPQSLRDVIAKWAAIKTLATVGDGLMAGFSSQSISLDGLSESFTSTQSATSAFFGSRIIQYSKDIKDWLSRNRYKFGSIPISFVGV